MKNRIKAYLGIKEGSGGRRYDGARFDEKACRKSTMDGLK
jgi:hypothetical protein